MRTTFEIYKELIQRTEQDLKRAREILREVCPHEIVMRKYLGKYSGRDRYCFICEACGKIFDTCEEVENKRGI